MHVWQAGFLKIVRSMKHNNYQIINCYSNPSYLIKQIQGLFNVLIQMTFRWNEIT